MSNRAISWALRQRAGSSGAKAVLIVLADMVRDEPTQGWPAYHAWGTSLAALTEATEQDRKSVVTNLQRLEAAGLIVPAGKAGKTRQITVYRLPVPADFDRWNTDRADVENSPETGTVPLLAGNSTVFPGKESRFPRESVPKTGHETLLNPVEPKEPFDAFWSAYPRKVAKPRAKRAFAKLKVTDVLLAAMLESIERHASSEAWTKDSGKFIPHPATWLNDRRWEDAAPSRAAASDSRPDWATRAGFANRFEAENAGCFEHNHHRFADGLQLEAA